MNILELKDVSVFYGKLQAVFNANLAVKKGAITAILGANGAGKSTLLKAISGLNSSQGGAIFFEGRNINSLRIHERVRAGIAMSPEGRLIFPDLTVEENLVLGAYTVSESKKVADTKDFVLTIFDKLKLRLKQKSGSLSGGEQQMLAIGRAMMSSPKLLLLDEPLLGISPALSENIFRAIQKIRESGTSILLVEQNALVSLRSSDYGYILEVGKVVLEGPAHDLLHNDSVKNSYLGLGPTEVEGLQNHNQTNANPEQRFMASLRSAPR